jgi:hypothetical protein
MQNAATAFAAASENTPRVNRRRNQRAGNCDKCRAFVEPQAGYLFKMRGCNATGGDYYQRVRGEWHVRCEACTLKTPSVRREMGLTGEQPKQFKQARERRQAKRAAIEALIAEYSDGTGCVPAERMEAYREDLAKLRNK